MTNDNDGSFKLSRRKALASMGAIGAAGALGVGGTYAQFSDTEQSEVTFTAGGIDGVLTVNGSYNGEHFQGYGSDAVEFAGSSSTTEGGEVTISVDFSDIKPGDYGCFNWGIEVRNNAAWVASCVDVKSDLDWLNFEPEIDADENVTKENLWRSGNATGDGSVQFDQNTLEDGEPAGEALEQGDLSTNMLTIPYYDGDGNCKFFDEDGPHLPDGGNGDFDAYTTPSAFWSNSEDGAQYDIETGEGSYLAPMTFAEASQVQALGTSSWNAGAQELTAWSAPDGASVGPGCVMLDGSIADENTFDNTQSYSPLMPGSQLNFGYDWHLPFATGNEAQGDKMEVEYTFQFVQERHTDAPAFGTYAPENQ